MNQVFARHETFHPRFGWLKKGFDLAKKYEDNFFRDDAQVVLGVGKNMVRSIRYWCCAFKLLEQHNLSDRSREIVTSDFGKKLLDDRGWDPFLEDPASLWLLHWNLLSPTCNATAWYFTFNIFRQEQFSVDDLFRGLCNHRDSLGCKIVDASLKKDVTCILRMYGSQPSQKSALLEDSIDCPFTELGIIQPLGDSKRYTFRIDRKTNLPPEIVVATCLERASLVSPGSRTIAISSLLYDRGSPGMVFKLNESAICDAIEKVARMWDRVHLSDTAGLIQFSFDEKPEKLKEDILNQYYRKI